MKRILSAIIISAATLTACSEEIDFTPGISFLTPAPEIFEETAIFRVIGQPFTSADSVVVPVTFGGSAEMGTDYDVSAEYVILRKDSPLDSIVVSTRQLGTGRNVSLSLEIPEGFTAGKHIESGFSLQNKFGQLSFESSRGYIADTTELFIYLSDSRGAAKTLSKDTPVQLAVNVEKSTAQENVDFKFVSTPGLTITAGASYAGFTLAPVGDSPREGKDKIVLNAIADERFDLGEIPELEISLLDKSLKVVEGNWTADTLITDSLYFETFWKEQCTGYDLVPKFSHSDAFQITLSNADFTPSFRSGLKNFFTGSSSFVIGDKVEITDTEGNRKELLLMSLDHTNRYFSETQASEDTISYVGIHLTKETSSDEGSETPVQTDIMELYFIDHTSKDFMPELESGMKYGTEKPVATEPGTYLMATFRKR